MLQILINQPLFYYIAIVVFSVVLVFIAIPSILHVARERHLFDDLDSARKTHDRGIPRLGGVGIFCSFTITSLLFARITNYEYANYLLTSCIILFAVGLKDDLTGVNPRTKLIMQLLVSVLLVILGDIRISNLYGILGVKDLAYLPSTMMTVLVIIFVINSFNLIDGVNGLAGSIGVIVNLSFGLLFAYMGESSFAGIAFAMVGAILGFLRYNYTPAKIFMGDTGSLLIGLVSAVLSIKFIELNRFTNYVSDPAYYSSPSIVIAILIVPVFDSCRIFLIRLIRKGSPFVGDRNHIHHRLLKLKMSHTAVTLVLGAFNLFMIMVSLLLQGLGNFLLVSILFGICMIFNAFITYRIELTSNPSLKLNKIFLFKKSST